MGELLREAELGPVGVLLPVVAWPSNCWLFTHAVGAAKKLTSERSGTRGRANASVNRRRVHEVRSCSAWAMKMPKAWPMLASAVNPQLGWGA